MTELLIASIDRAGDHLVVVGLLALVVAVVGLVYGLLQLAGRRRARRPRSGHPPEGARGRES